MSKCSVNDARSRYLIPKGGPVGSVQNPQPDFAKWAESDINLTGGSATPPLQVTDTSEQSEMSKNCKGAEKTVNLLGKVAVSNKAEGLPSSTAAEQQFQPPENTLTQHPKTDTTQTQQSGLKMQHANTAIQKPQAALTTAKAGKALVESPRRQRHGLKGRNTDDGRSQQASLPRILKSPRLNGLEQDSKTASKFTTVTSRIQQSDPTRLNHRFHPNTKGSTQRKADGTGTSKASGLKERKDSSKSSTNNKASPGFNVEPFSSKNTNKSLSTDSKVGKKHFTPKRGLVISKSALAGLSSPLMLSPRTNSAKTSPGSATAKSPDSLRPNKEVLRSSASVPGDYMA